MKSPMSQYVKQGCGHATGGEKSIIRIFERWSSRRVTGGNIQGGSDFAA